MKKGTPLFKTTIKKGTKVFTLLNTTSPYLTGDPKIGPGPLTHPHVSPVLKTRLGLLFSLATEDHRKLDPVGLQ